MGKTCGFPPAQTYYIKNRNVARCMPKPWYGVFPHCLFFFPHSNKGFYLSYVIPDKKTQFLFTTNKCYALFFFNISSFNASIFNITITFLTFSSYFSLLILLLFFSIGHMKYSVRLHSTSYLLFFYKIIFFPLAGGAFKTFAFI